VVTPRAIVLDLPPQGTLRPNHATDDPLPYYYRPVVGRFYRRRIETALALLEPPYGKMLEVGYGSGILLPTLARLGGELHGIDLTSVPDEVEARLRDYGVEARLRQADVRDWEGPDEAFDLVVSFSVLEHLADPASALRAMARVLKPGGTLLVGMPRVDRAMSAFFSLIGFPGIDDHHVTSYREVYRAAVPLFELEEPKVYPRLLPAWAGLYYHLLGRKRA